MSYLFVLVIFSGEFNSVVHVHRILFILVIFPMLEILISLLIVISLYSIRSAEVISEVLISNPFNYFEVLSSSSFLHTGAISLLIFSCFNGDFFEWAHNPQVFPRILFVSSNLSGDL